MSHRFVRCPHCKMPHDAAERMCPITGLRIGNEQGARSRMSELPPPERRPEPFAPSPRASPLVVNTPGTLQPTRNLVRDMIGMVVGGRYKVKGVLGEGGMGTVYDAEHIGLGRDVAIKVLNSSQAKKRVAVKRFQQEARAAGAIGHPNICEVYDMGLLDDGSPYLVMEKLVGQTLADRITKEGGLPFDELVEVMVQVLSGLIAAHDKGIIHRDIKPENIFLARRVGCPPIVKILDFGVSKMMPQFLNGEEQLDLTRTGMVMGTPYYMSPEQARGERNLDGRVDVYATGVMMYEAIAGKRPFLAPNYNALLLAIINTTPVPLRDIRPATPSQLEGVVQRAMAKNRGERYASAGHLLRDIQALPVPKTQGTGPRLPPPPPTREERMRAPILGGPEGPRSSRAPQAPSSRRDMQPAASRRDPSPAARHPSDLPPTRMGGGRRDAREPMSRTDGPGAILQDRMNEPSTRLDIRVKRGAGGEVSPDTGSIEIDIPIDITGSDTPVLPIRHEGPPPLAGAEYVDEAPTEVFRPGKHPAPPPPPQAQAQPRRSSRPPPSRHGRPARDVEHDPWEAKTVVRREEGAPAAPPPSRRRPPTPQPEQTVRIDPRKFEQLERAPESVDIDFSDETRMLPPRRR
jgi:eukaryotic-like serine/threonine-protein kinase